VLVPWVLIPIVLALLCAGSGLAVCRAARLTPEPWVLLPLGYAAIVVLSSFAVWVPGTASLATPAVVALAAAGLALWIAAPALPGRSWAWPAGAALAVFLVYAAPILLSGQATFAGYISLDDASTLFAMTDRALDAGRNTHGLAPSTYEATLATSLLTGYPLGSLLPLGIGATLTGQDLAWVFQPYLAFLAALLAFGLYGLARHATPARGRRAAVAFVASQPALLYGYAFWDGVKELSAAGLLVLSASLTVRCARPRGPWLAAGLAAGALLLGLSLGGTIWLVPAAAIAAAVALRRGEWRSLAAATAVTVAAALPAIGAAGTWLTGGHVSSWRETDRLANLIQPLSPLQSAGIWSSGDFRLRPEDPGPTYALVSLVLALALVGLLVWIRRRAWDAVALAGSAVVGAVAIWALGAPWVAAKAFATASPAVLLGAAAGCALLLEQRRRVEAGVAAAAVAGGVLWSNVLAFHHVTLAPRGQLRELETIGARFAGDGPALMTEYQPYGVRHFLRRLDPEGASELRRRPVPLRDGSTLGKGGYADVDEFQLQGLLVYRTLVLRRSPLEGRPPAVYRRVWSGRWYEVWQRSPAPAAILGDLPLGTSSSPAARAECAAVARIAALGPRVAATLRPDPVLTFPLPAGGSAVSFVLPRPGRYSIWVGGSTRERIATVVDGRIVATADPQLDNDGQYVELAQVVLSAGRHSLALRRERAWWRPGEDAPDYGTGPLAISATDPRRQLVVLPRSRASELCGRSLDWVEALG